MVNVKLGDKIFEGVEKITLDTTDGGIATFLFSHVTGGTQQNTIPEGGTYYIGVTNNSIGNYTGATSVLSEGDAFPEVASYGHVYVCGDYEYRYNAFCANETTWEMDTTQNGWGVTVTDRTKTSYGNPVFSIAGGFVTTMRNMFRACNSLETIDTAGWDTSRVVNMQSMFHNCFKLPSIDVSKWDTRNVVTMSYMFFWCAYNLTELDLRSWNTEKVTDMTSMFYCCKALTDIYVGSGWNTSNADTTTMFSECPATVTKYES